MELFTKKVTVLAVAVALGGLTSGAIAGGFGEQDWAALGEYIAQNAGL